MPADNRRLPSPARVFRELARIHVRAQRAEVARHAGTITRCTILTELGRAKSLSLGELASRLRLDKGWVSRGIDQLEGDGTALRTPDPTDARVVVITLTAKGRKEFRALEDVLDRQIESVFERLRPADRPTVAATLRLLHRAYAEALADDPEADARSDVSWAV